MYAQDELISNLIPATGLKIVGTGASLPRCSIFLSKQFDDIWALRLWFSGVLEFGVLGPVSERRLSENSKYVNPEMRETLGFPFQNGRFVKPEKAE